MDILEGETQLKQYCEELSRKRTEFLGRYEDLKREVKEGRRRRGREVGVGVVRDSLIR